MLKKLLEQQSKGKTSCTYQFHIASNTENKHFQMLRSVIGKNSQKMKATYQGMSKGIDTSGLWIPTQKVKRQRTTKIIGQNSEDFDLHFADLLFSVSIISDVHEIADFRSIHFLILGSNEHGSHTHQLQVLFFNFASGMLQVPKKIILTFAP